MDGSQKPQALLMSDGFVGGCFSVRSQPSDELLSGYERVGMIGEVLLDLLEGSHGFVASSRDLCQFHASHGQTRIDGDSLPQIVLSLVEFVHAIGESACFVAKVCQENGI